MSRNTWKGIGGADSCFNLKGGGFVNLDLYKRACEHPGVKHFLIPGEGTFHQYHGGVTTGGVDKTVREALMNEMKSQYMAIRNKPYSPPSTDPVYIGKIPQEAMVFVEASAKKKLETMKH